MLLKDKVLADIVKKRSGNIARFVSFAPDGKVGQSFIAQGHPSKPKNEAEAAEQLMLAGATSVNIRSFFKDKPDGNPFEIGLSDPRKVREIAAGFREQGMHVIINENLSLGNGSISGVLSPGNLAEFSANDSPRCVEKPGTCSMSKEMLRKFIETVYGRPFEVPFPRHYRVEFSQYPSPVGYLNDYTIIWQAEKTKNRKYQQSAIPVWPNKVSQRLGDKAFGLVMAHIAGERVPYVTINSRYFPLIKFGRHTNSPFPLIIRTAPVVPLPGKWITTPEPFDEFAYIPEIDPEHKNLGSMIYQEHLK